MIACGPRMMLMSMGSSSLFQNTSMKLMNIFYLIVETSERGTTGSNWLMVMLLVITASLLRASITKISSSETTGQDWMILDGRLSTWVADKSPVLCSRGSNSCKQIGKRQTCTYDRSPASTSKADSSHLTKHVVALSRTWEHRYPSSWIDISLQMIGKLTGWVSEAIVYYWFITYLSIPNLAPKSSNRLNSTVCLFSYSPFSSSFNSWSSISFEFL